KENILVTTSTISSYNNSLHKLKFNEDSLTEAIEKLSIQIKNVSVTSNKLIMISQINSILNNLETSLLNLSFQIEDITNSILFCNTNLLHPSIITPKHLYQELIDSYRHLPNGHELAVNLDISSIYTILSISKLVCYYLNHKIIFVLQIPLVSSQEFYLYHNIPLPIPHNLKKPDSFSMTIPDYKYTAVTKDKLYYSSFQSLEICKTVSVQNYICSIMNVFSSSANPSCESELLSKVLTQLPKECKTEFLYGNLDIWKTLNNNRWIFVQSIPTKLSIDCAKSQLAEIKIVGTGIVKLPNHCKAYCKNTKLYTNNNVFNISSPLSSFTNFNLIDDLCCNLSKFKETVSNAPPIKPNYIPHHCVIKESSSTTKLRVVFDGSAKSGNGVSLNECLLVGPKLQKDIETILLRFRLHEIVFVADIKQMFRGILLAIRTLQQLDSDEGHNYPNAAKVLVNDIFVDGNVRGAADLKSALKLKDELIALCSRGCFELRKWATEDESVIKVLGVQWNPQSDVFHYNVRLDSCQPLVAIPEPNVTNEKLNRWTRWQLLSNIVQHYWQRWSQEYLHTLQQRSKWTESRNNVKIGSLVVLKEDNLPPLQWRLGVIENTHLGKDGVVRVVSVRTAQGVCKRAVVKVCPLPDSE
ncbi:uncharacterized protein LOC125072207, partial [Vanessa atalanta]|uniref:uncharacterized protein LOC125072207 n=1 Tax=Vanessa atalanta TaxID=42275 RepID=UPI001FCD843F